ncbi:MAG: hypothetical protein KAI40_12440 [Desulfobacterales bacterium]|nr:hypothetical protein [Desulfobacterales bacterium]
MHPIAERYFSLNKEKQKQVHIWLCCLAYEKWLAYVTERKLVNYQESVCGTIQIIDYSLPKEAITTVKNGKDDNDIASRYQEPIAAIQDEDLKFSDDMELAYYAIYNLFNFHIKKSLDDSWLIVNQALAGLGEEDAMVNLKTAINSVA